VGLDPHLDLIPESFRSGTMAPADPATSEAVGRFLLEVVDRLEDRVAIVKPQIAFFERLGWRGLQMLDDVVARCRERGLLVLLDAKRGDIGSTAAGYAGAYLAADAPLPVDAMTLNPYLGLDTLAPFLDCCATAGRGVFVLVKTSNPGSGDVQDRELPSGPVYAAVASMLAADCERLRGPDSGWSSLGVVVGATYPEQIVRVREALPHALLLIPGFGAQGASAQDARAGFRGVEGGVVSSSRAILFPAGAPGSASASADWAKGFDAALRAAIDDLTSALA
jgi:orotidine-5'-phosphate decarboxylase